MFKVLLLNIIKVEGDNNIMSFRYKLQLTNVDNGKVYTKQIFGNNDWLPTFNEYCQSIGAKISGEYIHPREIKDIKKFLQAVDESVWKDVILPSKDYNYFDFSQLLYRKGTSDVDVSLYGLSNSLVENSYIFTSYMITNWLREMNAFKTFNITKFNLSYIVEPDYVMLGEIKDNFKLEISYY